MEYPFVVSCAGWRRAGGEFVPCDKVRIKMVEQKDHHPPPDKWHLPSSGMCPECWARQVEALDIQMSSVSS
jgi:hypothetical protein